MLPKHCYFFVAMDPFYPITVGIITYALIFSRVWTLLFFLFMFCFYIFQNYFLQIVALNKWFLPYLSFFIPKSYI